MRNSKWVRLLAYVTGSVNQELLLQNEYLAAENRILRTKLPARLRLSDPERVTLAEIGKRVGRKALREIACIVKPDTILAWYRKLIAQKFDGSKHRQYPGRPRIDAKLEALIVRMGREDESNRSRQIVFDAAMQLRRNCGVGRGAVLASYPAWRPEGSQPFSLGIPRPIAPHNRQLSVGFMVRF
jgi:hypothetical protein